MGGFLFNFFVEDTSFPSKLTVPAKIFLLLSATINYICIYENKERERKRQYANDHANELIHCTKTWITSSLLVCIIGSSMPKGKLEISSEFRTILLALAWRARLFYIWLMKKLKLLSSMDTCFLMGWVTC